MYRVVYWYKYCIILLTVLNQPCNTFVIFSGRFDAEKKLTTILQPWNFGLSNWNSCATCAPYQICLDCFLMPTIWVSRWSFLYSSCSYEKSSSVIHQRNHFWTKPCASRINFLSVAFATVSRWICRQKVYICWEELKLGEMDLNKWFLYVVLLGKLLILFDGRIPAPVDR